MGNTDTRIFNTYWRYFYFQHSGQSKIFQNFSFSLLGLPRKQMNLTMWNFPKVNHLKMVIEGNFLRLTGTVRFLKNEYFKNVNFLILSILILFSYPYPILSYFSFLFHSAWYNYLVAIKQIYFSPTFSKSDVHISDNIAGVE